MAARPHRERSRAIVSDLKNMNGKRASLGSPGLGNVLEGSASTRAAVANVFANTTNKRTRLDAPVGGDLKDPFVVPKHPPKAKGKAARSPTKSVTVLPDAFSPPDVGAKTAKNADRSTPTLKQQADEAKRKKDQLKQETAQWRSKYRGAIKQFTFFFDRVDPATEVQLAKEVETWGARVHPFFSREVTHVITSRPIPTLLSPTKPVKPFPSPTKRVSPYKLPLSPSKDNVEAVGPVRRHKGSQASAKSKASPRVEATEKTGALAIDQPVPAADALLLKALEFKIKVWKVDKLENVLRRLVDDRPPAKLAPAPKPSLPSLLRDEARQGHTLERDVTVPRSDYHYFSSRVCYFLVEDSTGQHRPIHVREYEATTNYAEAEWPIIRKGIEGKTAMSLARPQDSYRTVQDRIERMLAIREEEEQSRQRKAGRKLFDLGAVPGSGSDCAEQENEPCAIEPSSHATAAMRDAQGPLKNRSLLPAAHIANHPLRRSASMNILQQRQSMRLAARKEKVGPPAPKVEDEDEDPLVNATAQEHHRGPGDVFLAASGNSVSLTSNIASATSTALGPPGLHSRGFPDRRLAELNRKGVQMARPGSGLAKEAGSRFGTVGAYNGDRGRQIKPLPARLRAVAMQDQAPRLKRSQSVDGALLARQKKLQRVEKGVAGRAKLIAALNACDVDDLRKDDPKPGYCENCRLKYDDFKEHVQSRRHRKFARNDDNWWQLDELMSRTTRLTRPGVTLPDTLKPRCPRAVDDGEYDDEEDEMPDEEMLGEEEGPEEEDEEEEQEVEEDYDEET